MSQLSQVCRIVLRCLRCLRCHCLCLCFCLFLCFCHCLCHCHCHVTKIFRNSGSQFSELLWVSQMPQVSKIVIVFVDVIVWKVKSLLDHSLNAFFLNANLQFKQCTSYANFFPMASLRRKKYCMKWNTVLIYCIFIQLYTLFNYTNYSVIHAILKEVDET